MLGVATARMQPNHMPAAQQSHTRAHIMCTRATPRLTAHVFWACRVITIQQQIQLQEHPAALRVIAAHGRNAIVDS
eukprot:6185773-Pleurochrysis_carterae.AAC.4